MVFTEEKINQLNVLLKDAKQVVITAHKSPDGDSIGSSLALYHYLKEVYTGELHICHPDAAPKFLHWMQGADEILSFENNIDEVKAHLSAADLIFCLDFNSFGRVGNEMQPFLLSAPGKKVMIDHHLNPEEEGFEIVFSDTSACSTAQLVYELIEANANQTKITKACGEAIYTGIMTDTGSFRFSSTTSKTHRIVADLLDLGIENNKIHENTFDNNSVNRLQLHGYAISNNLEILPEYKTAIIYLTKEDLERFHYEKGDTEGLVNTVLSIEGIRKSIFLKESDGIIKISFRSIGEDNPVNTLASTYFHGGGHKNAAGGRYTKDLKGAIEKLKSVLPEFC
ncbi:phosphoesterase RecJ domain-containing protein [Lishizhenia tianjinensis]|uniref:Phosphoesterase RecJ domain-containing protein n=1 Tax=Lishizhenia tianjinensis TaxID=477690 RepID=A0A1I6XBZ8_9FLAO|nr:bifunctional oligoribonuclease/PAP phosphatase NrnA [Lishizhenia tianjinensis]SFT35532.1 phosphoesterase RecJ domain-containing protein [Lishizhenia tianjinensis]